MAKKSKIKEYDVRFEMGGIIIISARTAEIALNKAKRMSKKELIKKANFFEKQMLNQWEADRIG